jgi:sugar lactone lactonase YvrE
MNPQPWAHHGIAALSSGDLVTFAPDNRTMYVITPDGEPRARVRVPVGCAHGVTAGLAADGTEILWVADTSSSANRQPDGRYAYAPDTPHGRVVALRLDGSVVRELPLPPLPVYDRHRFEPTAVLPVPALGQVWVADGYGQGLVHRWTMTGEYVGTAPAGADGAFDCPHALLPHEVAGEPRVLLADREHGRLVELDADGRLAAVLATGLRRPACLARYEDTVLVGELSASLAQVDRRGRLIRRIGPDPAAPRRPHWPNADDGRGRTVRPDLSDGCFNSPHGIAVDGTGRAHIVEWVLGGRHLRADLHEAHAAPHALTVPGLTVPVPGPVAPVPVPVCLRVEP